jgi:hypothetical protein
MFTHILLYILLLIGSRIDVTWQPGPTEQQWGDSCVGYAFYHLLEAQPYPIYHYPNGVQIYQQAKLIDGLPVTETGTTPKAASIWLIQQHYLTVMTSTTSTVLAVQYLAQKGPILVGVQWFADMSRPVNGYVWPGGKYVANHEFMCYGYHGSPDGIGYFECQDSYLSMGDRGLFKITSGAVRKVLLQYSLPVKRFRYIELQKGGRYGY